MSEIRCPFCGLHPYEYVDVGIGHVPVAVNCCHLAPLLFDWRTSEKLRGIAQSVADKLSHMECGDEKIEAAQSMIDELDPPSRGEEG